MKAATTLALLFLALAKASAAALLGIEADTGKLYNISTRDASLSLIWNTGVLSLGALELAPNGFLYGFTTGASSTLYRLNLGTQSITPIGSLGIGIVFEGSLAFSPSGIAYGTNQNNSSSPNFFTINLATGAATIVGVLSGGSHDINGLLWRSDGMLVGLDRGTNSLLAIDPINGQTTIISSISDATVGGVGGMTFVDGIAYFSTGGPGGSIPGSNELFRFDPFSGQHTRVGSLGSQITGSGISGLASSEVPEPSTIGLLALSTIVFAGKKRLTIALQRTAPGRSGLSRPLLPPPPFRHHAAGAPALRVPPRSLSLGR